MGRLHHAKRYARATGRVASGDDGVGEGGQRSSDAVVGRSMRRHGDRSRHNSPVAAEKGCTTDWVKVGSISGWRETIPQWQGSTRLGVWHP